MLAVVIPAKNEAARIGGLLRQVLRLPAGLIIPVLNGCDDLTHEVVKRTGDTRVKPLLFAEPLGVDVPRIAGAEAALACGATAILFVDGDLTGSILSPISQMVERVRRGGADLVLADCYASTPIPRRESAAAQVYTARLALNEALGRPDLGPAIASHGPVVISRRLLEWVPPASLGVPPLMQAFACRNRLKVMVGAAVPHKQLGSAQREDAHRLLIAETIVGDCHQARCLAESRPQDRGGHVGYHAWRRFDLVGCEPPERAQQAVGGAD